MSEPSEVTTTPGSSSSDVPLSLTCGATQVLSNVLTESGWTKLPREKHAAGKIMAEIEDVLFSRPDPCTLEPKHPEFAARALEASKAIRQWERTQAPVLVLGRAKFNAAQACLKHFAGKEDAGTNRFFAELQEVFGITE